MGKVLESLGEDLDVPLVLIKVNIKNQLSPPVRQRAVRQGYVPRQCHRQRQTQCVALRVRYALVQSSTKHRTPNWPQ